MLIRYVGKCFPTRAEIGCWRIKNGTTPVMWNQDCRSHNKIKDKEQFSLITLRALLRIRRLCTANKNSERCALDESTCQQDHRPRHWCGSLVTRSNASQNGMHFNTGIIWNNFTSYCQKNWFSGYTRTSDAFLAEWRILALQTRKYQLRDFTITCCFRQEIPWLHFSAIGPIFIARHRANYSRILLTSILILKCHEEWIRK